MPNIKGWLHEVTATDWGVNTVWITKDKSICLFYFFTIDFFIIVTDNTIVKQILSHRPLNILYPMERASSGNQPIVRWMNREIFMWRIRSGGRL